MAVVLGVVTVGARARAWAYGADVHVGVVSMAWETMRAAADPGFTDHIAWRPGADGGVTGADGGATGADGGAPAPLTDPGSCALCGGAPQSAHEWSDFLGAMAPALAKLNTLDMELGTFCPQPLSTDGTLGGMLVGLGTNTTLQSARTLRGKGGSLNIPAKCDGFYGRHVQGGAYDGKWHPGGIFDATAPNPSIDGFGYQGLALGWQSKRGDDDLDDTVMTGGLVTALVGLAIIAVVAVAVFGVGGLVAVAAGAVLFLVIAGLACFVGWLSGNSCGGSAAQAATDVARATGFDSLLSAANGLVTVESGDRSGDYTGMWHFINASGAGTNTYDDRRGLFYNEAGPDGAPGVLDVLVQTGTDLTGKHLDFDLSKGPKQYETLSADDGHPNSVARDADAWEGEFVGHLEFAPLDNFGYFGWRQFRGTRRASLLRWPLHAIGDATVPMHVTGTSSWGHRPYESALDFPHGWSDIRYLPPLTAPELGGDNKRSCFPVTGPTKRCPEQDGTRKQLEQVRRILQHALRWHRFIQDWRGRTGRTTDVPVRDMITTLAQETRAAFDNDPTNTRWPFCDDCSYDYAFTKANDEGRNYYRQVDIQDRARLLVERAVGATVAFLLDATASIAAPPACATTTCSASTPCCRGTCQQGQCCGAARAACDVDADCCSGLACRNGQCTASATPQGPGAACSNGGAGCASTPSSPPTCATTADGVAVCCEFPLGACTSDSQCCFGACASDGRCSQGRTGTPCTEGLQCFPNTCGKDGALIGAGSGVVGTCCNNTIGSTCDPARGNADCCTGVCKQGSNGKFLCESGACSTFGAGCQTNGDCCSGVCGVTNANVCACSPPDVNAPCVNLSDCCGVGVCSGGVCVTPVVK